MRIEISAGKLSGSVCAPPSKSMAHRALICAYLSGKSCTVENIAYSADIKATIGALRALGADISEYDTSVLVSGGSETDDIINCGESGSTLRFMIPLCLTTGRRIKLCGTERLFSRSLSVYETLCREQGFEFIQNGEAVTVCGSLRPGKYRLQSDISSQFISGLMFVLPQLSGDSVIELTGKTESMPYIELTAAALCDFGVKVSIGQNRIEIPGNQKYAARQYTIEGDWSNAAFFHAMNTVGHDVHVTGLDRESIQGDKICLEYFNKIVSSTPTLDIADCPDLAPVLMCSMAANHGGVLTGTKRLKIKESDRGEVMAQELDKFGVPVTVEENRITVGHGLTKPHMPLFGHNDHRIVMALSILCTQTGGIIDGAQAINKSMPDFFTKAQTLGAKIRRINTDEA